MEMKKRKIKAIKELSYHDYVRFTEEDITSSSKDKDFKKEIYDKSKTYFDEFVKSLSVKNVQLNTVDFSNVLKRGNTNTVYFILPKGTGSYFGARDINDVDQILSLKATNDAYYFNQGYSQNRLREVSKNEEVTTYRSDHVDFMPMYYFDINGKYTALVEFTIEVIVELNNKTSALESYEINVLPVDYLRNVRFYSLYSNLVPDSENNVDRRTYFNKDASQYRAYDELKLKVHEFSINFEERYNSFLETITKIGLDINVPQIEDISPEKYLENNFMDCFLMHPKVLSFCNKADDEDLVNLMNKMKLDNYTLNYANFDDSTLEFYFTNKDLILDHPIYIKKYLLIESIANNYSFDLGIITIEDLDAFHINETWTYHSVSEFITLMDCLEQLNFNIKLSETLNYIRRTIVNQGVSGMDPYIEYIYNLVSTIDSHYIQIDDLYPSSLMTELSKLRFDNKYRVMNNHDEDFFKEKINGGELKYSQMLNAFNSLKLDGYKFKLLETREDINNSFTRLSIKDIYMLQGGDQKIFFEIYRDGAKKPIGIAKLGRNINRIAGINQNELDQILLKLNSIINKER